MDIAGLMVSVLVKSGVCTSRPSYEAIAAVGPTRLHFSSQREQVEINTSGLGAPTSYNS